MLPKYYENETMLTFMSSGEPLRYRGLLVVVSSFCLLWLLFFSSV